jgi:hypothetical protein
MRWLIDKAGPDDHPLMVLDYENNRLLPMNIHQAVEFPYVLEQQLGGMVIADVRFDASFHCVSRLIGHLLVAAPFGYSVKKKVLTRIDLRCTNVGVKRKVSFVFKIAGKANATCFSRPREKLVIHYIIV